MRPNRIRTPFAALLAAALVLITLTACHDDIPEQDDVAARVSSGERAHASEPESSRDPFNRQPSEAMNWGVNEQRALGADIRSLHVSYSVNNAGGWAWEGVSLRLHCFGGTDRTLSLSNLPWTGENRGTLLIGLDNRPPLEEDVYFQRYTTYGPSGRDGEQASAQLDEASWYDRLRSANTLTITLAGSNFDAVTFDLTRLFGTPLQGEIDECAPSTVRSRTN